MNILELTWWELIALLGLAQSLWLIVYMVLRVGRMPYASLAIACFGCLALAFLGDFGARYLEGILFYPLVQDMLWHALPVFSVLLALQIAQVYGLPPARYFFLLSLLPLIAILGWILGSLGEGCDFISYCDLAARRSALAVIATIAGGLSLLCLWLGRHRLSNLTKEKHFKSDRYWLILALIVINCALIFVSLAYVWGAIHINDLLLIRNILGCGLVYLASTSLFRLYPQTLRISSKPANEFNAQDENVLRRLEDLVTLQKVYQEPNYSRADLARELNISEAVVTRLVNAHFGKSVPQLLNQKRIEDAQLLLIQTAAPIALVAEQVGFNSVPSFNRVFKEITGRSPSEFREAKA